LVSTTTCHTDNRNVRRRQYDSASFAWRPMTTRSSGAGDRRSSHRRLAPSRTHRLDRQGSPRLLLRDADATLRRSLLRHGRQRNVWRGADESKPARTQRPQPSR
jgi:hypothetical protein